MPANGAFGLKQLAAACAVVVVLSLVATPVPASASVIGAGAPIDFPMFTATSPWNTDISACPVSPLSATYISSIGLNSEIHPDFGTVWSGAPNGIPYVLVAGTQPRVPVTFYYADESDPGPYPIPPDAPIEGGSAGTGDRHVLALDVDNRVLYELYDARYNALAGRWDAGSGAIWDLKTNSYRPSGWTSADAAGLPILPGLVRYDEVASGEITHALRFTVPETRRAFIFPASHFASDSNDPALPPMGMRVRLRADYDISRFPAEVQVILRALKKYGMIVADNGGPWYISGAPDARWNDDALHAISQVQGGDFEVVDPAGGSTGPPAVTPPTTPKIILGATARIHAGRKLSRRVRFSDATGSRWTATVNYGDGSRTSRLLVKGGKQLQLSHRYRRGGTYRITVKVRNQHGLTGVSRLKVVVRRR
jgi:hypothetical protein